MLFYIKVEYNNQNKKALFFSYSGFSFFLFVFHIVPGSFTQTSHETKLEKKNNPEDLAYNGVKRVRTDFVS